MATSISDNLRDKLRQVKLKHHDDVFTYEGIRTGRIYTARLTADDFDPTKAETDSPANSFIYTFTQGNKTAALFQSHDLHHTEKDPRAFTDLEEQTEVHEYDHIWWRTMEVEDDYRRDGLGIALYKLATRITQERGGIVVSAFTPDGAKIYQPLAQLFGFKELSITGPGKKEFGGDLTGWSFKNYGTAQR